jgi:hypothetical protein
MRTFLSRIIAWIAILPRPKGGESSRETATLPADFPRISRDAMPITVMRRQYQKVSEREQGD